MPFRARLRKTFSRKSDSPTGSYTPTTTGSSTPSSVEYFRRPDIEYYKDHEIPKPKYRGKIDPVHKERLEAFSFAESFQKRAASIISGSRSPRAQSRRESLASTAGLGGSERDNRSVRRKSVIPPDVEETPESVESTPAEEVETPILNGDEDDKDLTLEKTVTQGGLDHRRDTPFSQAQLEGVARKAASTPRHQTVLPKEDTVAV